MIKVCYGMHLVEDGSWEYSIAEDGREMVSITTRLNLGVLSDGPNRTVALMGRRRI